MALYLAIPKTSDAVTEVATGVVVKTVLQVATPSTTKIRVAGWGISFDGVVAANPAGVVTLINVSVAATVTTLTPEEYEDADVAASLCIGGTALTGYLATAEGAISGSIILAGEQVHPQTGFSVLLPERLWPTVAPSRFLRIRTLFSVDINCVPWILFDE